MNRKKKNLPHKLDDSVITKSSVKQDTSVKITDICVFQNFKPMTSAKEAYFYLTHYLTMTSFDAPWKQAF